MLDQSGSEEAGHPNSRKEAGAGGVPPRGAFGWLERSVEGGRKCGIPEVLEHVRNLCRSDAGKRERRNLVFGEKLGVGGLMAVLS